MSVIESKSILLITYYWPPSGGPGVQRPLKFAKYLSKLGHKVTVYTPSNGEYPSIDSSLLSDVTEDINVIRKKIFEPYQIFKKITRRKKRITPNILNEKKENSFLLNLSIWIRGNIFVPDARMFWIKPSVRYLDKFLKNNDVDTIITTGPPHSLHLIGRGLKRKTNIKWIADFRDPWTEIDYFNELKLTSVSKKKHVNLERSVLEEADTCITVTEGWREDLERLGAEKVFCIYNGYDEDDFRNFMHIVPNENNFIITHTGQIFKNRNYNSFWEAVALLVRGKEFKDKLLIRFIGNIDSAVKKSIDEYKLNNYFEHIPYVPHKEIPKWLLKSHMLYLPLDNTVQASKKVPGKVFEYLATNRPILLIQKEKGELETILYKAGRHCISNQPNEIIDFIRKILNRDINQRNNNFHKTIFSRESQALKLNSIINSL